MKYKVEVKNKEGLVISKEITYDVLDINESALEPGDTITIIEKVREE